MRLFNVKIGRIRNGQLEGNERHSIGSALRKSQIMIDVLVLLFYRFKNGLMSNPINSKMSATNPILLHTMTYKYHTLTTNIQVTRPKPNKHADTFRLERFRKGRGRNSYSERAEFHATQLPCFCPCSVDAPPKSQGPSSGTVELIPPVWTFAKTLSVQWFNG